MDVAQQRRLALHMGTGEVLPLRIAGGALAGGLGYGPAASRQPAEERARGDRGAPEMGSG